jgi:hypothetical protein
MPYKLNPFTEKFDYYETPPVNPAKIVTVTRYSDLVAEAADIQANQLAGTILLRSDLYMTGYEPIDLTGIVLNLNGFSIRQGISSDSYHTTGWVFPIQGTGWVIQNGNFVYNDLNYNDTNYNNNLGIELLGNSADTSSLTSVAVFGTFQSVTFINYVGTTITTPNLPNIKTSKSAASWGYLSFIDCLFESFTGYEIPDPNPKIDMAPFVIELSTTKGTSIFFSKYRSFHHQSGDYGKAMYINTDNSSRGVNFLCDGTINLLNTNTVINNDIKPTNGIVAISTASTSDFIEKRVLADDIVGKSVLLSNPDTGELEKYPASSLGGSGQLDIEIEGTFNQAIDLFVQKALVRATTTGRLKTTDGDLALVQPFTYIESDSNTLIRLIFHNLVINSAQFTINSCLLLTELSFPALAKNYGAMTISNTPALTSLTFTALIKNLGPIGLSTMQGLTSFSCPSLIVNDNNFNVTSCQSLIDFSFPVLSKNYGYIYLSYSPSLLAITFPSLNENTGVIDVGYCSILNRIEFPLLTKNSGINTLGIHDLPLLATLSFPLLTINNALLALANLSNLLELNFPALTTMTAKIQMAALSMLTTLSLPAIISYTNTDDFFRPSDNGTTTLTSVKIGTIGTLKEFAANIILTGQALTEASVDDILAVFATLDGTDGTILFNKTIDLSGGTSSTPSIAGVASAAIITALGGTVITN